MFATWLLSERRGDCRCFFCGSPCDDSRHVTLTVSFRDWSNVADPHSTVQCAGCEWARDEQFAHPNYSKPQKRRGYSWLITATLRTPFAKGKIPELRAVCLAEQATPWALAIAVSGQKQLLWRTPVNSDPAQCVVMLETVPVRYTRQQLSEYIGRATYIAAAIGKPVLTLPMESSFALRLAEYYGPESGNRLCEWWDDNQSDVARLAAFLSPGKEEARGTARA